MKMFLSAVPAMRVNTQQALARAMADAGFAGNRWSMAASRSAGQTAGEAAMRENAMLSTLLSEAAREKES